MLKLFRMHYDVKTFKILRIWAIFLAFCSHRPIVVLKGVKFTFCVLLSEIWHLRGSYCTNVKYKLVGLFRKIYNELCIHINFHFDLRKSQKYADYKENWTKIPQKYENWTHIKIYSFINHENDTNPSTNHLH